MDCPQRTDPVMPDITVLVVPQYQLLQTELREISVRQARTVPSVLVHQSYVLLVHSVILLVTRQRETVNSVHQVCNLFPFWEPQFIFRCCSCLYTWVYVVLAIVLVSKSLLNKPFFLHPDLNKNGCTYWAGISFSSFQVFNIWNSLHFTIWLKLFFHQLAGYYCSGYGLIEPTANCSGGYYCPGGQNTSTPTEYQCSPGHYCPIGSDDEVPCTSGEYQDLWTEVCVS